MNKKILIVDDEKNIRLTLKQCLQNDDYELDTAVNGEEAVPKILNNEYDLVLLDIKMPGLNGMEVLNKLREKSNKVNVIMMTAYGTIENAVEAMKMGAIDFVSKPFTPEEIREMVTRVLNRESLKEDKLQTFKQIIDYAKKCILTNDIKKAEDYLKKSIILDINSPEPHNLLGVINEYRNEINQAQKHYRAALALDPTYKPADKNLERTAQMRYTQVGINMGGFSNEEE
ncbi:response regulator [Alkaliphilus peptidifermentans]|uniref:Stage 0 sporulation protein A homolog n=1 Tax=Alkaliphilus peptidifermentans DSM 18978 TaxID=1120976 RepID=A0A1G5CKJ6_9FIRM|nr:response regulator [Alkaliphilus peptidifermentans]SCY02864.1 Tetratricopeptide repeat-containing protein [Alkaliphilus peptidifermentans DSM 18978]